MAKKSLIIVVLMFVLVCVLASCGGEHTHSYEEWETIKAATCTTEGIKERYCSCGEKQSATISMTEHTYGEWEITKEATYTEAGRKKRTCDCGETETKTIDILSTSYTISSSNWVKNFDLSRLSNFTLYISDKYPVADYSYKISYNEPIAVVEANETLGSYYNYSETINSYFTEGFLPIEDIIADSLLGGLIEILSNESDYGYSKFAYDNTAKYYYCSNLGNVAYNGDYKYIKISFENDCLTKIEGEVHNNDVSKSFTAELRNIGSTDIEFEPSITDLTSKIDLGINRLNEYTSISSSTDLDQSDRNNILNTLNKLLNVNIKSVKYAEEEIYENSEYTRISYSYIITIENNAVNIAGTSYYITELELQFEEGYITEIIIEEASEVIRLSYY